MSGNISMKKYYLKPKIKVMAKYEKGDWIISACDEIYQVLDITENAYKLGKLDGTTSINSIKIVDAYSTLYYFHTDYEEFLSTSTIKEKLKYLTFITFVLKALQKSYGHKTLDNIIQGLEAKLKYLKETNNEN